MWAPRLTARASRSAQLAGIIGRWSASTKPMTASFASGAMPLISPFDAAPVPAMMPATCVPWPTRSSADASSRCSTDFTRSSRSGCSRSIPLSNTAISSPLPVHSSASAPTSERARATIRLGGS